MISLLPTVPATGPPDVTVQMRQVDEQLPENNFTALIFLDLLPISDYNERAHLGDWISWTRFDK
jgi:hypothetical protein